MFLLAPVLAVSSVALGQNCSRSVEWLKGKIDKLHDELLESEFKLEELHSLLHSEKKQYGLEMKMYEREKKTYQLGRKMYNDTLERLT